MNAKDEFIEHIENRKVIAAIIKQGDSYHTMNHTCFLTMNHTVGEYDRFLNCLNFNYDDGYGGQELFGTIWYDDGTWSTRGEYDGSEWWQHNALPKMPDELIVEIK